MCACVAWGTEQERCENCCHLIEVLLSDWLMTGGMAQGLPFGSGRPSFWIGLPDNKDVLLFTSPSSRHFSAGQELSLSRRQLLYNFLQPHTIAAKFANATHTKIGGEQWFFPGTNAQPQKLQSPQPGQRGHYYRTTTNTYTSTTPTRA